MSRLPDLIQKHQQEIHAEWLRQMSVAVRRADLMSDEEVRAQSRELLGAIANGAKSGEITNVDGAAWAQAREILQSISASRAKQGFSLSETATFVLSLKQPVFSLLRQHLAATRHGQRRARDDQSGQDNCDHHNSKYQKRGHVPSELIESNCGFYFRLRMYLINCLIWSSVNFLS